MSERILLVEDDEHLAASVRDYLAGHGYEVAVEHRGDVAADRIRREPPDLVLLDINLPGRDGLAVCRAVRDDYPGVIVMLTARGEEVDEVVGLELGADDYLAKPVRPRVLLARIRSHLRRPTRGAPEPVLDLGPLRVDPARREVSLDGRAVRLTSAEFDLLLLLARSAGEVLGREAIYAQLKGVAWDGLDRSIDLRVSRLRRKLGDDPAEPALIKSVRGVGYMLAPP